MVDVLGKLSLKNVATYLIHLHPARAARSADVAGYLSTRDIVHAAKPGRANVVIALSDVPDAALERGKPGEVASGSAIAIRSGSATAYTDVGARVSGLEGVASDIATAQEYRKAYHSALGIVDSDLKLARLTRLIYGNAASAYVLRPDTTNFQKVANL